MYSTYNTASYMPRRFPSLWSVQALIAAILILTILRIVALCFSPLELGGDEAQYWAWSQAPDFGYFSKPPLIAWVIAITTFVFGDAEWAVRLAAPLAHAATTFFLFRAGRLSSVGNTGKAVGSIAALIYITMPGVWFSSGIITTDALLLPAIAGALAAYFKLVHKPDMVTAASMGLAIGIGFLAKYAMVYFCLALLALAVFDKDTRSVLLGRYGAMAGAVAALLLMPNLLWNRAHQFATISHTIDNAGWENMHINPVSALEFLGGQLGVFGILAFPVLVLALYWVSSSKGVPDQTKRLAVFIVVPLLIVTVEAIINRANANWAFSAYVPASLLLAFWGVLHGRMLIITLVLGTNLLTGTGLVVIALSPVLVERLGIENAFKRVHGWQQSAQTIAGLNDPTATGKTYDALLVDNRLFYYAVKYYGRHMDLPPMYIWTRFATPHSHAELVNPLVPGFEGKTLVISARRAYVQRMAADFQSFTLRGTYSIALGGTRKRKFAVYEAQDYRPLVRDEAYERQWPVHDVSW
ncbi:MAG: glycosyl transferase [Robiginitomaculum sp.]|nr:MAG: glycosyl transferase [Robiginitomaculum sp.]